MTWVLIFFVTIGGNPAMTSAEFNSKQACETAGDTLVAGEKSMISHGWFYCVSKG